MNNFEEIFFSLLRSAIWDTPVVLPRSLSAKEWNYIYATSNEQTVTGIMLDAISKLPTEQKPPKELLLKWILQQKAIEAQNAKMNKVLTELTEDLRKNNIQAYILKGQSVAQNYPYPKHRVCGDIDIFFKEMELEKAVKHLASLGCKIYGNPNETHHETSYKGISLELHKKSTTFFTNRLQKEYNRITLEILERERQVIAIDGKEIDVFPYAANSLQLLSHMLRHIITSGIGLRQVCDWVLYTNKYLNDENKEEFLENLKILELLQTYKAISAIASDYLGLPKEKVICNISAKDKKIAKKVLTIIMKYGNFGHYGEHSRITSKWDYIKVFVWKIGNCIRLHKLAKSETRNYPLWKYHFVSD